MLPAIECRSGYRRASQHYRYNVSILCTAWDLPLTLAMVRVQAEVCAELHLRYATFTHPKEGLMPTLLRTFMPVQPKPLSRLALRGAHS